MKYYMVDAFTKENFSGNPAGVCVLENKVSSDIMQKIAAEHNLSETAFIYKCGERYKLRWFTPGFEIDLCGHATLASAYVIFNFIDKNLEKVEFDTLSGLITARKNGEKIEMMLPDWTPESVKLTENEIGMLQIKPLEVYGKRDLIVVLKSEKEVLEYKPDYKKLINLTDKWLGIVITAKSENNDIDFVSRYFCPEISIEDPVTGSSHSSLVPLWSKKLNKDKLISKQVSKRGGILYTEITKEGVKVSGYAKIYMQGEIK